MPDLTAEDEFCPDSPIDQTHCNCWWDGEECCWCRAPAMPEEKKVRNGMVEGPPGRPDA